MGSEHRVSKDERSGRWVKWLAAVVVLLLVAGGAAWQTGWAQEWYDDLRGDDELPADPAAVAAPPEVDTADVVRPPALAQPADGVAALDRAALGRALAQLNDPDLGKHVIAAVGPLEGSSATFRISEGAGLATPASTTKVITSAAALLLLGPDKVFTTSTVLATSAGSTPQLVLVGGGDPYLARRPDTSTTSDTSATFSPKRADIVTLARQTAARLKADGVTAVTLGFDDTLFSGPSANPRWEPGYIATGEVSPVSALWVDEGRQADGTGRDADPAAVAAVAFRRALVGAGIQVAGRPTRVTAPPAASPVAEVRSPTVAQIVQRVLEVSDNDGAEVLLRHVGVADGHGGSFAGGQVAVKRALAANGVPLGSSVLYDGSGLSRANLLDPGVLVRVLQLAASDAHPGLRPILAALPVAGFTGSLTNRMDQGPAAGRGRVRAKTGTLSGVSSLAGIAIDSKGNLMAFALMADRIAKPKSTLARVAMDNAAAGLGACAC